MSLKKYLIKHPGSLFKTIWYSKKYSSSFKALKCSANTKIVREKGAEINIGQMSSLGLILSGIGKIGINDGSSITIQAEENASINIGAHVKIYGGVKILADPSAKVEIGDSTLISLKSKIFAKKSVKIGSHCLISWNVQILDSDHHTLIIDGEKREMTSGVTIGDKVWISSNVSILKGVTIGDNCVIAANSVVTKSFPSGVLIGGNPARILRENVDFIG